MVKKIVIIVIIAIVVLILAAIAIFALFGEKMMKVAIETAGTKALKVGVAVDNVSLGLLKGEVGISGLVIDNPPGYQHENLLKMGNIEAKADIGSLMSDTPHIKLIKLDDISVVVEQKGLTNNLKELMNNLPESKKPEKAPAPEPNEPGKKLLIDRIEINNVSVSIKLLPVPGKADTVTIKLDPIILENVGGGEKISLTELTSKILVALTNGIAKQGAGLLPDDMVEGLNTSLKELGKVGEAMLQEGTKVLDGGKKSIDETLQKGGEAVEGIKGLFAPKKKE